MVVLLVAHHVDHLVDGEVIEAHFGCTDVLGHVDACAVGAEQQLLVQAVLGEVGPHAAVVLAEEEALGQTFLHLLLAHEISVGLVVYLVEAHAQCLVGLVETGIDPVVHLLPESAHLGVALFPLHEHLVGFLDEGSLGLGLLCGCLVVHALCQILCLELGHLLTVVLVEGHVVVAYQMVALLAAGLRSLAVAPLEPCQHALADVYTAVVYDIGLHHAVAVGFHNLCQ